MTMITSVLTGRFSRREAAPAATAGTRVYTRQNWPPVTGASLLFLFALTCLASAQTRVQDIFGRSLNQSGITLVDWDGFLANPLVKVYLLPPTNAALPGSAAITANGARLYFDTPSTVSPTGPGKTVSLSSTNAGVPVSLSVFPDRDSLKEDYSLTILFTAADNSTQTNTVPIHVLDLDAQRTNDFAVTVNFDRDATGFFTNGAARSLVQQAAGDWAAFFTGMNLDLVAAGAETTYIWSNDFNGGYYFINTNDYTGYLLYAYGTTNSVHRSGGEGSYAGGAQSSGGTPLPLQRSGGFEAEIYGNYNTLGWLFLPNENDWLATGNLGNETNDFYSIAHHEIGHALIFNPAHSGFAAAKTAGGFSSDAVTNYYGGLVPIDPYDHLNGVIDPDSGQGAFGYEYYGSSPRKRWIPTKIDLLCAQEVGYTLRDDAAFRPLALVTADPLPAAAVSAPYTNSLAATGGIPVYFWEVVAGTLPPGLALDSFTGCLAGVPATNGEFAFTVRVRDYHETGAGVGRIFHLTVAPLRPNLSLSATGSGSNSQARLLVYGTPGQAQVIQVSSNLATWTPQWTNLFASNVFEFIESNASQYRQRFYRSVVTN